MLFTKGAPDILIARCSTELVAEEHKPLSDARKAEILKVNDGLADEALRTLAVAARALPLDAFEDEEVDEDEVEVEDESDSEVEDEDVDDDASDVTGSVHQTPLTNVCLTNTKLFLFCAICIARLLLINSFIVSICQ